MSLRVFETDDAKYYLGLGNHFATSAFLFSEINLSELDALVLENGGLSTEEFVESLTSDAQYRGLFERWKGENPFGCVYGVDWHPEEPLSLGISSVLQAIPIAYGIQLCRDAVQHIKKDALSRRSLLKAVSSLVGGAVLTSPICGFIASSLLPQGLPSIEAVNSLATTIFPTPLLGMRDALTARKVSGYIVPSHKQPKEKAHVALVYGWAHSGIEEKLQYPWLAEATLEVLTPFFDEELRNNLNRVIKVTRDSSGYTITKEIDCGLF